ncbi:hypothetical protein [Bradyrhizobium barranii]
MQQDVRKNYISIVNDAPDHEQEASTAPRPQPGTMKDFVGRLATVLKRRLPAAPGPTITPRQAHRLPRVLAGGCRFESIWMDRWNLNLMDAIVCDGGAAARASFFRRAEKSIRSIYQSENDAATHWIG